jgi:hypothetical protein
VVRFLDSLVSFHSCSRFHRPVTPTFACALSISEISTDYLLSFAVITKYRGGGSGKILVVALEEHLRRRQGKAGVALRGQATVLSILHAQMYAQGAFVSSLAAFLPS